MSVSPRPTRAPMLTHSVAEPKVFLRARMVDGNLMSVASACRVPQATQAKFDELNRGGRLQLDASTLVPFGICGVSFVVRYANGVAFQRAAGLFDSSKAQDMQDMLRGLNFDDELEGGGFILRTRTRTLPRVW